VSESFDYQSIEDAVNWKGTAAAWQIQSGRLQSRLQEASSSFYISTPSFLARQTIWEWWMRLDFNTSSLNYVDVFLTADSDNLLGTGVRGYYVRIGNTKDEVCLYRKDGTATPVLLIDGRDGITDRTSTTLKIRVTRNEQHEWDVWVDETGSGNSYVREGKVKDSVYNTSSYMGFLVRQSTASFFNRHYFDDVSVRSVVRDTEPPLLQSLQVVSNRELTVCFNEPLDSNTIFIPGNYLLTNDNRMPDSIWQDAGIASCMHLWFKAPFANGDSSRLQITGIKDQAGNVMVSAMAAFLYYETGRYDVLIHEILPRALPSAGLLPARFIELRNNSPYSLQLKGWRLSNSSREVVLPAYLLHPDSLLVICDRTSVTALIAKGPVLGVSSFPAPGDSDIITLRNDSGTVVHAVGYDRSWYTNTVKAKGGWSLEMVAPQWPCAGSSNWKPAIAKEGGTPGAYNSVAGDGVMPPPVALLSAYPQDAITVRLSFSGMTDSLEAVNPAHYHFTPSLPVMGISAVPPLYNNILLQLENPLSTDTVYRVSLSGLSDCTGQEVVSPDNIAFAQVSIPDSFDIVINEVLYDPATGVPEFVEIYNRSHRTVNVGDIYLAKRKETGELYDLTLLSDGPVLLLPAAFAAFTSDPDALCRQYICKAPGAVYKMNLPALTNGKGTIVLLNGAGQILDELHYSDNMQIALANNTRGVSLERLQADERTQDKYNWHSAAGTAGYATPGYKNSQQLPEPGIPGSFTVTPPVFSPDNDGIDDLAVIRYSLPAPGYIINITVFDAGGRVVRYLERNSLLATSGYLYWDGRGEANRSLVTGIYIIFAEVFNAGGKSRQWKLPIVLAKRIN
jgi:hypothetical protein